ncbi:MAG: phosphonatase-like hydrolase [Armatimonadota bacterium]
MSRSVQLVVSDMAGTTVRDDGQVLSAFLTALRSHGVFATPAQVEAHRGAAKRRALAALLRAHRPDADDRLVDEAYRTFRKALEDNYRNNVAPVRGAEDTFSYLRDRGIKVALNTGFYARVRDAILAALRWDSSVIDAVVCADDVPEGRPAPYMIFEAMMRCNVTSPAAVIAVGDTPLDLIAGTAAGCGGVVGVLTGSHDALSLGRVRHTHLIPSVADLPDLIATEF